MSSVRRGYRLKGNVRETRLTRTWWQQLKLNKDENMIGSINAADRKTQTIIENDAAKLSVHPRIESAQWEMIRSCIVTVLLCWSLQRFPIMWGPCVLSPVWKHHLYLLICLALVPSTLSLSQLSAQGYTIFQFSISSYSLSLAVGPLICLREHPKWLLCWWSHTWSMPPALFLSQRLSKGNNQTMTLSKTFPFVLNTS